MIIILKKGKYILVGTNYLETCLFYLCHFNTTIHFLGTVARARLSRRTRDSFVAHINRAARGEHLSAHPTLRSFQSLVWG